MAVLMIIVQRLAKKITIAIANSFSRKIKSVMGSIAIGGILFGI
jgi:hypothetical protein